MFDTEEEYVGVDDEHMYIHVPPAQPSTNDTPPPQQADENADNVAAEGGPPLEA